MNKDKLLQLTVEEFFNWLSNVESENEGNFSIFISDEPNTDNILKLGRGTLLDFIEVEKLYCETNHISFKTYWIELQNKQKTSHCILVFDNKIIGKYYYMETFNKNIKGIYESKDIDTLFKLVASRLSNVMNYTGKYKVYRYTNMSSYNGNKNVGLSRTPITLANYSLKRTKNIKKLL